MCQQALEPWPPAAPLPPIPNPLRPRQELLALPVLVVFDEAYIEFSDVPSKMRWVAEHENLIILRTFSKCAAMAGLRLGYAALPLSIADVLWRCKQPYTVTVATQEAGLAALQNLDYINVRPGWWLGRGDALPACQQGGFAGMVPRVVPCGCAGGELGRLGGGDRCRALSPPGARSNSPAPSLGDACRACATCW